MHIAGIFCIMPLVGVLYRIGLHYITALLLEQPKISRDSHDTTTQTQATTPPSSPSRR
jgi:hypothetical protein